MAKAETSFACSLLPFVCVKVPPVPAEFFAVFRLLAAVEFPTPSASGRLSAPLPAPVSSSSLVSSSLC
jgi:hypothetical protein